MSQTKGKVAFEMRKREVELTRLLPTKLVKNAQNLKRYRAIVSSIPELGVIEPLMVYPQGDESENWRLHQAVAGEQPRAAASAGSPQRPADGVRGNGGDGVGVMARTGCTKLGRRNGAACSWL